MYISDLNLLLESLNDINPALVRDIYFSIDELHRIEIPRDLLMEAVKLCAAAVEDAKEDCCDKLIVKHKNMPDASGTIILVSYEEHRKLLSKIIKKLKDITLYFSKTEWNQRYYVLMFLGRDKKPLKADFIAELEHDIKSIVK